MREENKRRIEVVEALKIRPHTVKATMQKALHGLKDKWKEVVG